VPWDECELIFHHPPDFIQQCLDTLFRRFDEQFASVLADILTEEIETILISE